MNTGPLNADYMHKFMFCVINPLVLFFIILFIQILSPKSFSVWLDDGRNIPITYWNSA